MMLYVHCMYLYVLNVFGKNVSKEESTRLRKRELREKQVIARMNESKKKAVKDVESQQNQNEDGNFR